MKPLITYWSDEQLSSLAKALEEARAWRFHEAHEELEAVWRTAHIPVRTVLHTLILIIASHHQLTLGRGAAAVRTWHKARPGLAGVEYEAFCEAMEALHGGLGLSVEGPRYFDPSRLSAYPSLPMLAAEMLHAPSA